MFHHTTISEKILPIGNNYSLGYLLFYIPYVTDKIVMIKFGK